MRFCQVLAVALCLAGSAASEAASIHVIDAGVSGNVLIAVPEPRGYALLLAGLGALGLAAGRRKPGRIQRSRDWVSAGPQPPAGACVGGGPYRRR